MFRECLILATVFALAALFVAPVSALSPTQCGKRAPYRTLSVFIDTGSPATTGLTRADALSALEQWNVLWRKYHGFNAFAEHHGGWWNADVLVTAAGYPDTWVHNDCAPSYTQRGRNTAVVFVGKNDRARNAEWFVHELGHALYLPDYTNHPAPGHVGARPCGHYIGIMSYCASRQTWLLGAVVPGAVTDAQLVRDYYR